MYLILFTYFHFLFIDIYLIVFSTAIFGGFLILIFRRNRRSAKNQRGRNLCKLTLNLLKNDPL